MAGNLRARLARIRGGAAAQVPPVPAGPKAAAGPAAASGPLPPGWENAEERILQRTLSLPLAIASPLPDTLPLLLPDLVPPGGSALDYRQEISPQSFLFFDLETTGLSGGAGTVAFLAAFGRWKNPLELEITQFLLLDYPGEAAFLQVVLNHLGGFISAMEQFPEQSWLTTYNGKAFDSQILKTRCLMNGFAMPFFRQADLLHPARRLWKRVLPSCSQAVIETEILGLDRSGDMPGAMAPGIWFNFLRSGADFSARGPSAQKSQEDLLGICDHNVKDIYGLASLFCAFAEIAALPLEAPRRFRCDAENLSLCWRRPLRRNRFGNASLQQDLWDPAGNAAALRELETTARDLLENAAAKYPRSTLRLAFDLRSEGSYAQAREMLLGLRDLPVYVPPDIIGVIEKPTGRECPAVVKALALRALAADAERQLGNRTLALSYLEEALVLSSPSCLRT